MSAKTYIDLESRLFKLSKSYYTRLFFQFSTVMYIYTDSLIPIKKTVIEKISFYYSIKNCKHKIIAMLNLSMASHCDTEECK